MNLTAIHEFFDALLSDAVAYKQFSEAVKAFDQYFITWGSPLRGHLIPMSNFARVVPTETTELYRTDLFPAEAASKLQPGSKFAYRHPHGNPYHAWTTIKKPMLALMKDRLSELPASKRSAYVPVFLKCVPPANSVCWHPGMVPALKAAGAYLKTKSAAGKKLGKQCTDLADSVIVKEQEFILVPRAFPIKAVLLKSFGKPNMKLQAKQRLQLTAAANPKQAAKAFFKTSQENPDPTLALENIQTFFKALGIDPKLGKKFKFHSAHGFPAYQCTLPAEYG